ncbi:MAG: UvrD-helicase domain-containing protein, partial [Spirochaetota bacterium]
VLESDATVRDYYKARFDAIMIDEFQDNNEEQKRLLYLLAERDDCHQPAPGAADLNPSKLFFVGDEKQSIYRFRGADVSVFRMLADELGGERAQLILGANYRSEPGLIRFFNSFFAHVFAGAESAYEARFLPLRFRDASPGVHPTVEHWRVEKRTQGDGDFLPDVDAQAYHIAARLRRLIESQTLLVGPDARPAEYRDVAILLKSSSNQIRLERMFRLFGIPYVSGAVRSLFLEAPVSDLYNVLQLAVYPDDRVAYAAYLRSPLVGLSDEGLVRQLLSVSEAAGGEAAADGENAAGGEAAADGENAAGGEAAADGENAAGGLFDPAAGLSAEDHRRLARAHERYEQIVAAADARPITELLFVMWYEWGYRYHLLRREEYVPYLEYFDLFWELAHSFEQRGLAAFLDEVRRHLGENQKLDELEYLGPEGEGVEIMTVHKSKGLEFPVVIVANTENAGRNDSVSGAPYYWDNELGPAWNIGYLPEGSVREKPANYLYTAQAVQAALEEAAERKRLLYVAATRAESHLIFCGLAEDRKNSFNELITPAFQAAQEEVAEDSGITASIIDLEPVAAEQEFAGRRSAARTSIGDLALRYDALPTVERRYVRPEISVSAVNAAYRELAEVNRSDAVGAEGGRPPLASDALIDANDLGAEFGTLCHELIERAPTGGYPHEREARLATARAVAGFGAAISRRTPKEQATLLADAVGLAESFLGSEEWRRIEADVATGTASVAHELAFLLQANAIVPGGGKRRNVIVRGKIDLLIEYSDQIEIIDFKSDRVVEAEHYAMQLVLYRQAARELYGRPVRVALFDLRAATLLPVSELPDEELLQKSIAKAFFV